MGIDLSETTALIAEILPVMVTIAVISAVLGAVSKFGKM